MRCADGRSIAKLQCGDLLADLSRGAPPRDVVTLVHTLSGQPCSRQAGGGIPVRQLTRITWIVHAGPVGAVNVSVPSASVVRVCCWAV
jgi:hypothetical protein